MAAQDKPARVFTVNDLDIEESPDPFVFQLPRTRKRITFPPPGDLDAFTAEEFLFDLQNPQLTSREALSKWLSEDDFTRLLAEKPSLNLLIGLIGKVQEHYQAIFGGPGESDASES
jgi:hypothetical protein